MKITVQSVLRTGCGMLLLFIAGLLTAQGNLQFNQVKIITGLETVPVGKVWKVEAFLPTQTWYPTGGGLSPRVYLCAINGTNREVGHSGSTNVSASAGSTVQLSFMQTPFWLPEGGSLNPTVTSSFLWGVSVIEFNVVP